MSAVRISTMSLKTHEGRFYLGVVFHKKGTSIFFVRPFDDENHAFLLGFLYSIPLCVFCRYSTSHLCSLTISEMNCSFSGVSPSMLRDTSVKHSLDKGHFG
uniref:Uncharacterized protein n=1 Tax=Sipha flava TaxID=143950 RepID=A0A2S2QWZ7_9HEMI